MTEPRHSPNAPAADWPDGLPPDTTDQTTDGLAGTLVPPAASGMNPAGTSPAAPPMCPWGQDRPAPPAQLGEYEMLHSLGAGGMGDVWKARHRRLDRLVAVKLLGSAVPRSEHITARFLREMRALGQLEHPNVAEALDAGEQGGVVYLVMKLVEGTDLQKYAREKGPLPIGQVCDLGRQVARGLGYLHSRGLVHRDVKPSNAMVTPAGVVKVLDLGLACWQRGPSQSGELTAAGQVLGTPDYLAPEQAVDPAGVDGRADLYGLGGLLFALLTGQPPFARHASAYDKIRAHAEEPPPDVRTLRPEVPAKLAALVTRLLAKRPEDRPSSAAEVESALAEWSAGEAATLPPSASPVVAMAEKTRPGRRLVASSAVLVVILAALGLGFWLAPRMNQPVQERAAEGNPGLRVLDLKVNHFRHVVQDGKPGARPAGALGERSFIARLNDSVDLEAELSAPAYAYIIAYRPDGSEELCFPESEDEAPPRTDRPRYPSVSRGVNYGLNEGAGLQAFAVVVSSEPLPPYRQWRAGRGRSPWGKHAAPGGVVWVDGGDKVESRLEPGTDGITRGKGQEVSGKGPMAALTAWLRSAPGVEAVRAVGFPVVANP